ncbi:MAG: uracil phosphoribosyltransferase [Verrucomicrobiota bacterium]|nr:uracil phosphoribosyltransferase [Verrucomicrobiota bacterium]
MSAVHLIDHSLVTAKMSRLRDKNTSAEEFRRVLEQIAILLLSEVAKEWPLSPEEIETPLAKFSGQKLARPVVFAPILRAGLGLLEGMARVMPEAAVGHIGLYRDEQTLRPVKYYCRLPRHVADAQIVLLDPMLATGRSACAALALLKEKGATAIQFACVVACQEGIAQVASLHPEIPIFCAAIDPLLNEAGYIVPGLGDAGDRYFGTT